MIPDALYYRARAAATARRQAKGRNGAFVNLLTGLVSMGDGHPAHIQTGVWKSGTGRHLRRAFVSAGHRASVKGSCPLSIDYFKVEKYLLAMLYQLKPADLLGKGNNKGDGLREKEQELAGVELRLAELEAALGDSKQPVPQLIAAIAEHNAKRDSIKGQIEQLRQRAATITAKPLEAARDILATLARKPEAERHNLRLKLRGLIADIVSRVEIEPYRKGQQTEARIAVWWKGGLLGIRSTEVDTALPLTTDEIHTLMTTLSPFIDSTLKEGRTMQEIDRAINSMGTALEQG
jgi:hypothetical protein